jgi:hypothetical protein
MMKNLLSEGRYDKVTTELSREIVDTIKRGSKRLQTRIVLFKRTYVDISVYIHYKENHATGDEQVYGATYLNPKDIRKHYSNKRIILHVEVPKDPEARRLGMSDLVPEIKNIVRHEIEHVTQNKFKDRERQGFFSNKRRYPEDIEYYEYLMEPYEVEAYVRGLYKKAKTLKQPLNVLLNAWWDYLESVEVHPDEIRAVKNAWIAYAKKHLPQTPLRQYGYREEPAEEVVQPQLNYINEPDDIVESVDANRLFEAKKDTLKSKWSHVSDEVFNQLVDADPSPTKKYAEWMLKTHIDGGYNVNQIIPVIQKFDQINSRITHEMVRKGVDAFENEIGVDVPLNDIDVIFRSPKDINSYKGLGILTSIINQVESKKTKKEEKLQGAEKIYEDENFLVILPKTKEGSCHYGSGTRWCVAARESNQFDNYSKRGTLYYIIFKANTALTPERRNKPIWQARLPRYEKIARFIPNGLDYGAHGEFYDAQDNQIEEDTILNGLFGVGWRYLEGLGEHIQEIPKGSQAFYDSFYKAWTRIDTHYAKNGMQKSRNSHDDYWDDDDFDEEIDLGWED